MRSRPPALRLALVASISLVAAHANGCTGDDPNLVSDPDDAGSADAEPRDTGAIADSGASTDAPWTPASLDASVVLWLDGEHIRTDGGLRWEDRSANGNDAIPKPGVADAAPSVATADGGRRSLVFAGSPETMVVPTAPTLEWGTDDFAVFVVANGTGNYPTSNLAALFTKWIPGSGNVGPGLFLKAGSGAFTQVRAADVNYLVDLANVTVPGPALHVTLMRRRGSMLYIRVDDAGAGRTVASVDFVPSNPNDVGIGGSPGSAGQYLVGTIAEVIAVRGPLPEADVELMIAYLRRTNGL